MNNNLADLILTETIKLDELPKIINEAHPNLRFNYGVITFYSAKYALIHSIYIKKEYFSSIESDTSENVLFLPDLVSFESNVDKLNTKKNVYIVRYAVDGVVKNQKNGKLHPAVCYDFPITIIKAVSKRECSHIAIQNNQALIYDISHPVTPCENNQKSISDKVASIIEKEMENETKLTIARLMLRLNAENIDWKKYANGKKSYEWIRDLLPQYQISDDNSYVFRKNSVASKVAFLIEDELSNGTQLSIAKLITRLNAENIDWKRYANGKKSYEWIRDLLPQYAISDDSLFILRQTLSSLDPLTQSFVNSFCCFPKWQELANKIIELTDEDSVDYSKLYVGQIKALASCLVGLNGGMLDDSNSDNPQMAYLTGLITPQNQEIYGILVQNKKSSTQSWMWSSVAYPGQNTDEGKWLCNRFGIKSQVSYGREKNEIIEKINNSLETIRESRSSIMETWDDMHKFFDDGSIIPIEFSESVSNYIDEWNTLRKNIEFAGVEMGELDLRIETVERIIEELNSTNLVLKDLEEKFDILAGAMWSFMVDSMLCVDNLCRNDIEQWHYYIKNGITDETVGVLHQLINPFQAMRTLRSINMSRVLGDEEFYAIEEVNRHFGSSIAPLHIKYSICNPKLNMDFLGLIDEIEMILNEIELENSSTKRKMEELSDDDLLNYALSKELWTHLYINPNVIEKAAMLGDIASIHKYIENKKMIETLGYEQEYIEYISQNAKYLQFHKTVTPVNAAKRLEALLGSSCKLIDTCLLLGLLLNENGANEALINHYINTNRNNLVNKLFRSNESVLSVDVRRRVITTLVSAGDMDIDTAIQMDITLLLSEKMISTIQTLEYDKYLTERLLSLYEKVKPTLIHHIVHLSPELQSYILSPENSNDLLQYPIDYSEKGVIEMLRQNSYVRGFSPLQVAQRVYAFVGNWNDVAREFAYFAPDNIVRSELLFEIYNSSENEEELLSLLCNDAKLRQSHIERFVNLLYKNSEYETISELDIKDDYKLSVCSLLQIEISMLKVGIIRNEMFEINIGKALKHQELVIQFLGELLRTDFDAYLNLIVKWFPIALVLLEEDELRRLVTIDNSLNNETLYKIASETAEICPKLNIYCSNHINLSDFENVKKQYIQELVQKLNDDSLIENTSLIRELYVLAPEKYVEIIENLLVNYINGILISEIDREKKATEICNLLCKNAISDEVLCNILELLSEKEVVLYPALYNQLNDMIRSDDLCVKFLSVIVGIADKGDEAFLQFLCEYVIKLEERNLVSQDILLNIEAYLLERVAKLSKISLCRCVSHIEKIRGRDVYALYAEYMLEVCQGKQIDNSGRNEITNKELALLCDALEDDDIDIINYLYFCSYFIDAKMIGDSTDVKSDDIGIILRLYRNPENAETWNALERVLPQERSKAYAISLYHHALYEGRNSDSWKIEKQQGGWTIGKVNLEWGRCVEYCIAENQGKLFFEAISKWLEEIDNYYVNNLPWYVLKHFMITLQSILEKSDYIISVENKQQIDFPTCDYETAVNLIEKLIYVFKRIEYNCRGEENHPTLRVIIELAVRLKCEDLIIKTLSNELANSYVNLGLALICRLLLVGKTSTAKQYLSTFVNSTIKEYNYSALVKLLADMTNEQSMNEWISHEENRALLRFILPNGNAPDILRLQNLVMNGYSGSKEALKTSISVAENLILCYPKDVMCYKTLFILCKGDGQYDIQQIYKAVVGLYKYYPMNKRYGFTRSQDEYIKMIVILNAVMSVNGIEPNEAESVTELIRNYYHVKNHINLDDTVSRVNLFANELSNVISEASMDSYSLELLCEALLNMVTGNYISYIEKAFNRRLEKWSNCLKFVQFPWGMLRGLFQVWQRLVSFEEKNEFVKWVTDEIVLLNSKSENFSQVLKVMNQFKYTINNIVIDNVNWSMLRLPWEEHFVCIGDLNDISRSDKNCCYKIMMLERPKGKPAKDCFILFIKLAQDSEKAKLLLRSANDWFEKGDYLLANSAYGALAANNRILPVKTKKEDYNEQLNKYIEIYQTWTRISNVMIGGVGKKYSAHSSLNMMIALINQGYIRYFDRLRPYFSDMNLKLFFAVRKIISLSVTEIGIMDMVQDFVGDRATLIAFLHFVLCSDRDGNYLIISDRKNIESLTQRLKNQEDTLPKYQKNKYWFSLEEKPLYSQLLPLNEDSDEDIFNEQPFVSFEMDKISDDYIPSFLKHAKDFVNETAYENGKSAYDLQKLHEDLTTYSDGDYSKRIELSAKIYLLTCEENTNNEVGSAVARFGIDYYYYYKNLISKSSLPDQDKGRIHSVMLELAMYSLKTPAISAVMIEYIPNWLQFSIRNFTCLDDLLRDFSRNKQAYIAISQLLSDTEYSDPYNGIIETLMNLVNSSNRLGTMEIDMDTYQIAYTKISEIVQKNYKFGLKSWNEMLSTLNDMVRQSINKLDQRPSLKVTILNPGHGLQIDGIYGEIENTGRETAYSLELQAVFTNNTQQSTSGLYSLAVLRPNEKAAFALNYKTDVGQTELEYTLYAHYNHNDLRNSLEPISGILALKPNVKPPSDFPRFNTQQANNFSVDEQGNIVSQYFKGRNSEIRSLTGLVRGKDFARYGSAVVQGIKRSGKTSLLNYFRTYLRVRKEDNIIPLFVDCQYITSKLVYKTFFKSVLDELPLEYTAILDNPEWEKFVLRWRLKEIEEDRDPEEMSLFFRQLSHMLDGKGIYLIVDEFDWLLARLNDKDGYDNLLRSLRSLQMNADCFNAIHLLLCGSNRLLVYNRSGSVCNQMFQSYQMITVGQMLVSDVQKMITNLIEDNSSITFVKGTNDSISPSIKWIERYTGGLVWYTRLLVNEAIRIVLSDNRNCVYPSDICLAFDIICNNNNCRQLDEGCDENERIVLEAMQTLSDSKNEYITYSQIYDLVGLLISEEQLKKSLSVLTDSVELLEKKSPSIDNYRFRMELYRRYFRTLDSRFKKHNKDRNKDCGDCFRLIETDNSVKTIDNDSAF